MGWYAFFDQNGDMAEKTRRRVYDMVAARSCRCGASTIRSPDSAMWKDGSGYRVVPTPWNPTI